MLTGQEIYIKNVSISEINIKHQHKEQSTTRFTKKEISRLYRGSWPRLLFGGRVNGWRFFFHFFYYLWVSSFNRRWRRRTWRRRSRLTISCSFIANNLTFLNFLIRLCSKCYSVFSFARRLSTAAPFFAVTFWIILLALTATCSTISSTSFFAVTSVSAVFTLSFPFFSAATSASFFAVTVSVIAASASLPLTTPTPVSAIFAPASVPYFSFPGPTSVSPVLASAPVSIPPSLTISLFLAVASSSIFAQTSFPFMLLFWTFFLTPVLFPPLTKTSFLTSAVSHLTTAPALSLPASTCASLQCCTGASAISILS